ncbi:MAG TPA: hypothetical protein VGO03_04840 [Acidimicrobiia bacterium]
MLAADRRARRGREARTDTALLVGLLVAVFAIAGFAVATLHWTPVGDWAVAELILRHMPATLPLSGAYSATRGYNHPLPWMYYLEWLPYRLSGDRSAAELATLVWWNGACLALLAWLLARRQALMLAAIAIPLALVMASRGDTATLLLPWNPYFAVFPAFVLVFAAWRFAVGDTSLLPLVVALALLATGMHLAYLPSSVAVVVVAMVWHMCARRARGNRDADAWRRPAIIAACVALVVLAPALVDLVLHGRASNPWQIAHQFAHPSNHIPPSQIFHLLGGELAIPPTWMSGRVEFAVYAYQPRAQFPWLLVAAVPVVVLAYRRRARDELALLAIASAALAGGTLGLLRANDTSLKVWYALMMHVGAATVFIALAWSTLRTVKHYVHTPVPKAARLGVAVIVIGGTSITYMARQHVPAWMNQIATTMQPLATAGAAAVPHHTPVVVNGPYNVDGYYSEALVLMLARDGVDVRVPTGAEYLFTRALRPPSNPVPQLDLVISTDPERGDTPPAAGARRLRSVDVPQNDVLGGHRFTLWYEPT